MRIGPLGIWELAMLFAIIVPTFLFWRVFKKAGLPGPLALATLIPPFGLVSLLLLTFMDWPGEHATDDQSRDDNFFE